MSALGEIVIAVLLVIGGGFGLVGGWGLVRLPDPMTRLHAPTKAATLGVGAVLVASMATMWFRFGILSWHEFLIALFLFLTAPIGANLAHGTDARRLRRIFALFLLAVGLNMLRKALL